MTSSSANPTARLDSSSASHLRVLNRGCTANLATKSSEPDVTELHPVMTETDQHRSRDPPATAHDGRNSDNHRDVQPSGPFPDRRGDIRHPMVPGGPTGRTFRNE